MSSKKLRDREGRLKAENELLMERPFLNSRNVLMDEEGLHARNMMTGDFPHHRHLFCKSLD